jgi:hypothetical protein
VPLKSLPDPILCSSNTTSHHVATSTCAPLTIRPLQLFFADTHTPPGWGCTAAGECENVPFRRSPSQPRSRSSLMWLSHNRTNVLCALSSGAHGTHTRSLPAAFRAQAEPSTTVAALGAASQHKVYLQEQLTALRGAYTRWSVDRELGRTNEIVTSP